MTVRNIMWGSLLVQVAMIIVILPLVVMQKVISDFIFDTFLITMYICLASALVLDGKNVRGMHELQIGRRR